MRNKKRKRKRSEEEGTPAWMNTYGDMITLVLTLFVLLFSFSTIDVKKFEQFLSSLSGTPFLMVQALDPGDVKAEDKRIDFHLLETPEPTPVPEKNMIVKERFDELYEKIKKHIEENRLESMLNVHESDDTIVLRMTDSALFDSGKIEIKEEALIILYEVCEILQEYTDLIKTIIIEGHTDNVPISTAKFESNWELSLFRAANVRKYIDEIMDIDPAKLYPAGCSEYRPLVSNDTEEGKARNRRVDFIIESINKN